MTTITIPDSEIDTFIEHIRRDPDCMSMVHLHERYQSLGLEVLADPFSPAVTYRARDALRTRTPYSVIRLGDAEMTLLAFGAYDGTPGLDRYAASATIRNNDATFGEDELWVLALREMMMAAVLQADVVGVLGLWRPGAIEMDVEAFIKRLRNDLRGYLGLWRGRDYMLKLARAGVLRHTTVASAHLYFGLLRHLREMLADAERILLITDRPSVADALRKQFPDRPVEYIAAARGAALRPADGPRFLHETAARLPHDLRGCCALVGAGPWAKIYCTWIKQRGGVGLDLGSGFDLLAGKVSRPIHRRLGLTQSNPYALISDPREQE